MNWVDVLILGTLVVSIAFGVFRGALKTLFSLGGVVIGFMVASRESGAVGMVLSRWMRDDIAAALGFLFVFLGIAVAVTLAGWLFRALLEKLWLGWVDHALGGLVGFVRAAILVGVAALLIEGVGQPVSATRTSATYPWALAAGRILLKAIPPDTLERLDWDALRERLGDLSDGTI